MTSLTGIILALSLMIIMFGMGLSLAIADFKRIFTYPKAIFVGLLSQIVLLPLVAYFIATGLNLSPVIAIGLMMLAACPGGATSNLLTHLAKGDLALSVSLTAIASILSIFTIPFIIQFALQEFSGEDQLITVDSIAIVKQLFLIVIIPIAIGMFINAKFSNFAKGMEKPVKKASAIIFILVIIGITISLRETLMDYLGEAGLPSILLNVIMISIGFSLALVFKLSRPQAISIAIETGIQNATLAITLATITLNNAEFSIFPAIYGLLMYISASLIIFFHKRLGVK